MKYYRDFKVDEGVLVLKEILEVMFASENISLPVDIYNEVLKLQKNLVEYLEGNYTDKDMIDRKLLEDVFIKKTNFKYTKNKLGFTNLTYSIIFLIFYYIKCCHRNN